jgi:hypothetical protein
MENLLFNCQYCEKIKKAAIFIALGNTYQNFHVEFYSSMVVYLFQGEMG